MNYCVMFFITVFALVYAKMVQNSDSYGPYALTDVSLSPCPVLKENNLVNVSIDNNAVAIVHMNFIEKMKVTSLKVSVHNVTQGQKSFLWNYKVKDPCKHMIYAVFLKNYLKADNNCNIKPGVYQAKLYVKDMMSKVFGTSFFYGHYFTKSDVSSKNGTVLCFVNSFNLIKK